MKHKFTSREEALEVLAQLREYKPEKAPLFIDDKFPEQAAYIRDIAPRISGLCTRRAGKSEGANRKLYNTAYLKPNTTAVYIGLTRQTAKDIMWEPMIKKLNHKMQLGGQPNETELSMVLPSVNSRIRLLGMDKDASEMHKVLGQQPSIVLIDEAGSFRINMEQLVYEMIEPSLLDHDGQVGLLGTPTDLLGTLFHKVTKPNSTEPDWSRHSWNTTQNPYMREKWEILLARLRRTNPRIEETPGFKRMYLGQWVEDVGRQVYKYQAGVNDCVTLFENDNFTFTLGVDLGFTDSTAFVLGCYGEHDRNFYILTARKEKGLIFSAVAEIIHDYIKKFPIATIVIDGANKQGVEEMRQRYGIPFIIAEKQGKVEFIELMNSDFMNGFIKLFPEAEALRKEYTSLIWDDQVKHKKVEHPSCENHCADAALYAYRHALQYLSTPRPKDIFTDEEKVDEWLRQEEEKINRSSADPMVGDISELHDVEFIDGV